MNITSALINIRQLVIRDYEQILIYEKIYAIMIKSITTYKLTIFKFEK